MSESSRDLTDFMVRVLTAPDTLKSILDSVEPLPPNACTGLPNDIHKFFTTARGAAKWFKSHVEYVDSNYHFTPEHIYKIMEACDGLLKLQPYNHTTMQTFGQEIRRILLDISSIMKM